MLFPLRAWVHTAGIAEEGHGVEQRALAVGVGADQDVEAVDPDVHVAEAGVVGESGGLDAAGHDRRSWRGFLTEGGGAAVGVDAVLDRLEGGSFLRAALGQLDQGLHHPGGQLVAPQPLRLQVAVHAALLACLPELHQLVDAVDQGGARRRPPTARRGRGRGGGSRV